MFVIVTERGGVVVDVEGEEGGWEFGGGLVTTRRGFSEGTLNI